MSKEIRSEDRAPYAMEALDDDSIIKQALEILGSRLKARPQYDGQALTSPNMVRDFLKLSLAACVDEVFCVLYLDTRHRVIAFEELFRGTVDSAHVHPRVVVRRGLECNAAAAIIAHNHPSGVAEPSQADVAITRRLREALGLVDVRLLDHFIVGEEQVVSMAERGLV